MNFCARTWTPWVRTLPSTHIQGQHLFRPLSLPGLPHTQFLGVEGLDPSHVISSLGPPHEMRTSEPPCARL